MHRKHASHVLVYSRERAARTVSVLSKSGLRTVPIIVVQECMFFKTTCRIFHAWSGRKCLKAHFLQTMLKFLSLRVVSKLFCFIQVLG